MNNYVYTLIFFLVTASVFSQGGVGINNSGANPDVSSMLDISSSNKGILIPRVSLTGTTDVTSITSGNVLSLLVFNTATVSDITPGYYYWDGTAWKTMGGGDDADADPNNEIELPAGGTNGQVLSTDGNGIYSWINQNLGSDDQNIESLAFDNTTNILTVGIENGGSQTVDLTDLLNDADASITNEIQDLSINTTSHILTITNNGSATSVDLTPYLDNTDNQNVSGSGLSGNTLTIGIENGSSETVDLSSLTDHDWYEVGATTSPDAITDNIFTQGNVGIGTISPQSKLHISGAAPSIVLEDNSTTNQVAAADYLSFRSQGTVEYGWVGDGSTGGDDITLFANGTSNDAKVGSLGGKVHLSTGTGIGSERLTVIQNGNVGIGTLTPSYKTHLVSTGATELMIEGASSGLINAGVVLKANTSTNYRGTGVFMYDLGGQNEWYAGRPYAFNDTYVIQRNSGLADHNALSSALSDGSGNTTTTERFFSIDNEGDALVNGTSPAPSAKLEVRSTNKGFLPPQIALTGNNDLTTVVSPASGLLIYNTATAGAGVNAVEPGHYYFNGIKWKPVGESSDWYLDNSNSFKGSITLNNQTTPANTFYSNYVNLQKGVYMVNFYNCLLSASDNYYIQATAESSTPADLNSGFNNIQFSQNTVYNNTGFVIYVRKNGTPVRFKLNNPANSSATITQGSGCSSFIYSKISE